MPNSDPRDGFFYPYLTVMIDSNILASKPNSVTVMRHGKNARFYQQKYCIQPIDTVNFEIFAGVVFAPSFAKIELSQNHSAVYFCRLIMLHLPIFIITNMSFN